MSFNKLTAEISTHPDLKLINQCALLNTFHLAAVNREGTVTGWILSFTEAGIWERHHCLIVFYDFLF